MNGEIGCLILVPFVVKCFVDQKGFALILILLIFAAVAILGLYFWDSFATYGRLPWEEKSFAGSSSPKPTQAIYTPKPTIANLRYKDSLNTQEKSSWKKISFKIIRPAMDMNVDRQNTTKSQNIVFSLPVDWTAEEVNYRSTKLEWTENGEKKESSYDCYDYEIKNENRNAHLSIKRICDSYSAKSTNWPQDAVVVKELGIVDTMEYFRIRFFDNKNSVYKYVNAWRQEGEVNDALFIDTEARSQDGDFVYADLLYSGPKSQKTQVLKYTDEIIATVKLE